MSLAQRAGLGFVFIWFFVGGIGHFLVPDFFLSITPPWVPFALPVIYLSGIAELMGAFALLSPRLRPWAGLWLLAIIVAVTPVHIYMLQVPEKFPQFPIPLLWLRLVIQAGLIVCVWRSTRAPAAVLAPA